MDSYYADGGALVFDPNNSSVLYSGGHVYVSTYNMAISKTTNSGTSWMRDTLATSYSTCNALRVDPSNSNMVYAGGYTGLYRSTNAGATWAQSSTGLSGTVNDIAIDPVSSSTLYAGTSSGVFKSTNSGSNWSNTGCTGVTSIVIDVSTITTIYAGTNSGVYFSTNGGSNWTAMNEGLLVTNVTSMGLYHDNYLYAGTDGAGMWRWTLTVGAEERYENTVPIMLLACHPKPARGNVTISYVLSKELVTDLSVYDVQGRLVAQLARERQAAGDYSVTWYGKDTRGNAVPSGIYFCKLVTDDASAIEKIILVK
ncbi:MAG: FlgD immunoglobulin-like domain containing protein [bacterium]